MTLEIGDTVAAETPLDLTDDPRTRFGDYRGAWLVVYFYPKDATSGCTTEAGDFTRLMDAFRDAGTAIIGVSRDSLKSHENFRAREAIGFPLASDPEEALCTQFDVMKMKNMYGKQVRGVERSTFLIDPDGVVREVWRKVKVPGHAEAVLERLRDLV